jgi:aspartate aminotransferase
MVEKYSIYMTANGRISVAGITEKNVDYIAESMKECIEKY